MKKKTIEAVDLSEMFMIIWSGKAVIISVLVSALLFGFGYVKNSDLKYKIKFLYSVNVFNPQMVDMCGGALDCVKEQVGKELLSYLRRDHPWQHNIGLSEMFLITENPLTIKQYENSIKVAKQSLTSELYNIAILELDWLEEKSRRNMKISEELADAELQSYRFVQKIVAEKQLIGSSVVTVEKVAPKEKLILLSSLVLGLLFGILTVLIRYVIRSGKNVAK